MHSVSVGIPTLNSARTLALTLRSLQVQSISDIQVVVIDGFSSDDTRAIARDYGVESIITTRKPLLAARLMGIEAMEGKHTLLLDADQVLRPSCLSRAIATVRDFDAVCIGESTYNPERFLPRLIQSSRSIVQSDLKRFMNPYSGLILPRFFRTDLLKLACSKIPAEVIDFVSDRDHQIIYFEFSRLTRRIGFLPDGVDHIDPTSWRSLWQKSSRWGRGAGKLYSSGYYRNLLSSRYQLRRAAGGGSSTSPLKVRVAANVVSLFKGIPYEISFTFSRIRESNRLAK